ncbi:MAG: holo-ACP synthase [Chloroflexi bacterium]|nr:holo-ACP synthase [Chloroflexota bacterium]
MLNIGLDIVEIERIEATLNRWRERFLHRVYTTEEIRCYQHRVPDLAARFAAKEAMMKALGTGIRGVGWRDIEILSDGLGAPVLNLYGRALDKAQAMGLAPLAVSLSHSQKYAIAAVIGGSP